MKHRKSNWDAEDDKAIGKIWSPIFVGALVFLYQVNLYRRIKKNANPDRELTPMETLSKFPIHYSRSSEYSWENLGRMGSVKQKLDKSRTRPETQGKSYFDSFSNKFCESWINYENLTFINF